MAPNSKINLKDKVDDGEMDLSLCDLQDVPVKEIAAYKKVYSLDLSNNRLIQLPKNFPILTNLIKLDLSKNKIKSLPENFGELIKLKHLDLYKNEIAYLPLSFCNLKGLKWLDLKDNQLVPAIQEAAGQCLDAKQCQSCATNIVQFFTKLNNKVEEEREIRDKQRQRDKQANEAAALKLKQQEKKSNKKKDKPKKMEEEPVETVTDEPIEAEEKVITNKETKSAALLPLILTVFLLAVLSLFVLTSVKFEKTIFIEEGVVGCWSVCMENAPPAIQDFGNKSAVFIKNFHEQLGKYILELERSENVVYFVNKIKYYYGSVMSK